MTTAPDIFISYASEDRAVARCYADAFAAEGLSVWWDDHLRSGEAFDEAIEAALRAARAVVVLWSPRSVISRWVRAEATIADRFRTMVPVTIEPCERPIIFELTQTADMSSWRADRSDPLWRSLVADVRGFVERDAADSVPAAAARPAASGERGGAPSLVILPFANRSGHGEDEVFAIGMVEDLIEAMSQGVNLRVLSSSTTERFRNAAIGDIEALARQLGVRYLLEGNVRRAGAEIRVTVQLVDASGGEVLWTRRFDRPLAELAALQEDLVVELAAHLGTQVYRVEMTRALAKPANLTAWECVTRAMFAHRTVSAENLMLALAEAQRAVEIAPDYGVANAMYAATASTFYFALSPDNPAEVERLRAYANRGLALEPDNPVVIALVAQTFNQTCEPARGLDFARRAIQWNAGYGFAFFSAGVAAAMLGLSTEARDHFTRFSEVEPDSHLQYNALAWRAHSHMLEENWVSAEAECDRSIALNPAFAMTYAAKSMIAARSGKQAAAIDAIRTTRQLEPMLTLELLELRRDRMCPDGRMPDADRALLGELWAGTEAGA